MADTVEFFTTFLPKKLENPALTGTEVFQFDVTGAGTWSLDLGARTVTEGPHANPGCKITVAKADWEAILDNPAKATQMFMMGKLKATNIGLATKLQKILA